LFHAIVLGGPGGDRLSRVLRHSTMGAEAFDGRVRDGIGSLAPRKSHQAGEERWREASREQGSGIRDQKGRTCLIPDC